MKKFFLIVILGMISVTSYSKEDVNKLQVIGGDEASIEEVPWQAALYRPFGSEFGFGCGAIIIDERWILTAAHCINDLFDPAAPPPNESVFIKLGIDDNEEQETDFLEIEMVVFNNDYEKFQDARGDMALLKLKEPLDASSDKIEIIELLTPEQEQAGLNAPGTMALTSGWGSNDTILYEASSQLMKVEIPIVHLDTAKKWFSQRYPGDEEWLYDDQIPAGFPEGGKSSCFGDSGGPLVVRNEDDTEWLLTGVVSWGPQCAGEQAPGVYSRVPYHYNWIMENIERGTPKFETELALQPVAMNFKAIRANCNLSDESDFYLNFLNTGTEDITSFDFKLSVIGGGNVSQHTITIDLQEPIESGAIHSVWDDLIIDVADGDARIELEVTSINGETPLQTSTLVENIKVLAPVSIEFEYDFQNSSTVPVIGIEQFGEEVDMLELTDQEGIAYLIECLEEDFYRFTINIPESEGELKVYMTDEFTGEKVLVYYWNDEMSSEVVLETFSFDMPFTKETYLEISNFEEQSYCENLGEPTEISSEITNSSNYFIGDITTTIGLNGNEVNTSKSIGLNPGDKIDIMEIIDFDGSLATVSLDVESGDTDLSDIEEYLNAEFIFNSGTGEIHNITYTKSIPETVDLEFSFANIEDGNEAYFSSTEGESPELCLTEGCYAVTLSYTQFQPTPPLSGDVLIINTNGDEIGKIVLDNFDFMESSNINFELCLDIIKGVSTTNLNKSIEINGNMIQFNNEIIENIAIYDINGNKINFANNSNSQIDLSQLNTGVYFFNIKTNKGEYTDKFLKY